MSDVSSKIQQARAHFEAGRAEQARALLERALRQAPGQPELCNAMSLVLMAMGRLDLALYNAQRAVQARPDEPAFLQNLGNTLSQLSRHDEAIEVYRKVLAANPDATGAHLGISHSLRLVYRFAEATSHLRAALTTAPDDPELLGALAPLLLKQARVEEAAEAARRGLGVLPGDLGCGGAYANLINYLPGATGKDVLDAHRIGGGAYSAAATAKFTHSNTRDPVRVIRVGVLSGDLRRHAVAFFLESFFAHHDRASIRLAVYSTTQVEDEVTARLKSCAASWANLYGASPATIAGAINKDRIDILIELAGHMAGHNLPAIAMRPAPIQVNYLGYPATTGVPEITHRIVDTLTDPPGHEAFATERLVRIDPSFLCYRPPDDAPETHRPTESRPIAFGSFNSAPKINTQVIRVWSRLLQRVPGSTLTLKALEFYDPALGPDLLSRFVSEGIDPARIAIHRLKTTFAEHLASYNDIDIALDTFPYNGTTTTFEALFMGVPVVTTRGDRHVARVSAAILTTLGHPELIAADEDEYIALAVGLAGDASRRGALHGSLRRELLSSALCDAPALGNRLSAALRTIWQEWCAQGR